MKKILIILFLFISVIVYSKKGFYLLNRYGVLIKVDVSSISDKNDKFKKGPSINEVPDNIKKNEFESKYLSIITNDLDKNFVLSLYDYDLTNDIYFINKDIILKSINSFHIKNNILINIYFTEKKIFTDNYKLDSKSGFYNLKESIINKQEIKNISYFTKKFVLRLIFLEYNKNNEYNCSIDSPVTPIPHNFPRVFNPKTKSNFDIHLAFGYKFDNNISFGISINLTNFIMPSLEIMLKYNFFLSGYPFEPYLGCVIYGGFMDGFPTGLSAIGGVDYFPLHNENNRNLYLSGEIRLGGVLYSPIYFDTGKDNEGIWKKFSFLTEGGFYFGIGNRWD